MIFFFRYNFLIIIFVCLLETLEWFQFSGTKDKIFQIVDAKGCGLCSDFLKSQNQSSSHGPEALKPSGELNQRLLQEAPYECLFNRLQPFAVPTVQGVLMEEEG